MKAIITVTQSQYTYILKLTLWLASNALGTDGAAIILTSLQNISTLRILSLSYNNISSTSVNGIAVPTLKRHDISVTYIATCIAIAMLI